MTKTKIHVHGGNKNKNKINMTKEVKANKDYIKIQSYVTWKKNNNPTIFCVKDGIKGWAVQTVCPTIEHYGWKQCIYDYEYNITENTTPKKLAIKKLVETWGKNWIKNKEFVYYVYHGTNGYMDAIYVWYKE